MVDAAPRHISDVQQAVDAADIDERTVFGEVLDRAFDDITDVDLRHGRRLFGIDDLVG